MLEDLINWLLSEWMPHRQCLQGASGVVGLQVTADTLIWAAFVLIAVGMLNDYRRYEGRIAASGGSGTARLYLWIAAALIFCSLTHAMRVLTVWRGYYLLDGVIGMLTAFVCWGAIVISTIERRRGNVSWLRAELDQARELFASTSLILTHAARQLSKEMHRVQRRSKSGGVGNE